MTWAIERRLDMIDLCLLVHGQVRRADLIQTFGVSAGQASMDLNEFIRLYPRAMVYDRTAKCYVPAARRHRPVRPLVRDRRTRAALMALTLKSAPRRTR